MVSPLRLGIDLGGTKIELLALGAAGNELWRKRVATPKGDYQATLMTMVALVEEAENALHLRGTLGVGIPGTEAKSTGLIKNANSTCLIGQPLRRDLQALLQREVRIANDANCFSLSEASDGAAAGAGTVFGVILGTGVGGGIVVNGQVLEGVNSIAGEWGHNLLPVDKGEGPACYCGRRGCVETYLSGPGLAADHRRVTGQALSPEAIIALADGGDTSAEATLCRYEARLAQALAVVINILDPEVIVLGGGLSNVERFYRNVPRLWGTHVFSDTVATGLVRHRHGDSSGVRGAAWLWS
ncbi:MAG TPA: ROK family protein [Rhodocyclaceae bacterium]|jgi:fructokinase